MRKFLKAPRIKRNSETWQVVYIDLMTNMLVIFVILWSLHQGKPVKLSNKTGDTTSQMVNLPGDIIFAPGKTFLTNEGKSVFRKLFSKDETGQVLNFTSGGFTKRYLVIHGHTDGDGDKNDNFQLGFDRALASYHEMKLYSKEIPDHVILCSHADNSPMQEIPALKEGLSQTQLNSLAVLKAKNRRITIEDKFDSRVQVE